ncbi:MAG: DUF4276 family protein [Gemmataceae bacterium]|nr:DUF4276 family protein [Gemmataceae bacterium]
MTLYIAPVVEGQTEQGCVERLLHRVWFELLAQPERLQVLEPFRGQRDALVHPDGKAFTESVQKAFLKLHAKARKDAEARSLLLILLDAEGDCPATLAPRLLAVARAVLPPDSPVACVLPKRMLENWIVAGCTTLAGVNGLPSPLSPPANPEDCGGSGWLSAQLRSVNKGRKYTKTADAKVFVAAMDLQGCRDTASSFDKLCRELEGRILPPPQAPLPEGEPPPAGSPHSPIRESAP